MCALTVFAALSVVAGQIEARPAELPVRCRSLIARDLPGWKRVTPFPEVEKWARQSGINPSVAVGDFDGDGTKDWATIGTVRGRSTLVLCRSTPRGESLAVVEVSDGFDYIGSMGRGTSVPNLDTGENEILRRDTVVAGWFERAERAFVYEGGSFRVFFISDG